VPLEEKGPGVVNTVFAEANKRMLDRFALIRKIIDHPGEKGDAVEETARGFWREFLPRNVGITSGFVMDAAGGLSKQMDIIFYDALRTPIFFAGGNFDFVPVECTLACCEVKSDLNSKALFADCFEKAASYKKLKRTAYHPDTGSDIYQVQHFYGKQFSSWQSLFFVMAITGASISKLLDWYMELRAEHPGAEIVDSVCVVDRGVLAHRDKTGPMNDRRLYFIAGSSTEPAAFQTADTLVFFYMLATTYLLQGDIGKFRPAAYLSQITHIPFGPGI
jgi:hypothetical protein